MANILTPTEASNVLRCAVTDAEMLALLPLVDAHIKNASGRDWALDATIRPEAKSAARMLLVRWHEDPGGMAAGNALGFGLMSVLVQLEALALQLAADGVPDEALELEKTNILGEMAVTASIVLVFNHEMAAGATSAVTLKEAASGTTVAVVGSLDTTAKILTVNPTPTLTAETVYLLEITDAPDVYGQALTTSFTFRTA